MISIIIEVLDGTNKYRLEKPKEVEIILLTLSSSHLTHGKIHSQLQLVKQG